MAVAGPGTGLGQALAGEEDPAAHNREIYFRMELEAVGLHMIAEGLCLEILPPGEQCPPARQIETFPVPLVDVIRELAIADAMPVFRRMDRVIAHFHTPLRVRPDAVTKMAGKHLGAKTNAQKGRVFLKRDPDPVNFPAQPGIFVVDAHGPAENDHASVASERVRQRVPESGTAAIKLTALHAQDLPDPPGSRMSLMQDDEYPAAQVGACRHHSQC
jgi:hypothetical protein